MAQPAAKAMTPTSVLGRSEQKTIEVNIEKLTTKTQRTRRKAKEMQYEHGNRSNTQASWFRRAPVVQVVMTLAATWIKETGPLFFPVISIRALSPSSCFFVSFVSSW
jgi:hypothetical protein